MAAVSLSVNSSATRRCTIYAFGAVADLAAVDDAGGLDRFDGERHIGIGHHNGGGFSAQFEVDLGDVGGRPPP